MSNRTSKKVAQHTKPEQKDKWKNIIPNALEEEGVVSGMDQNLIPQKRGR